MTIVSSQYPLSFSSTWDASGQIPQRLVDNGTISRFDQLMIQKEELHPEQIMHR
jgi:hypothetical protein